MEELTIKPIAYIRNDFTEKFGIPRQGGLIPELKAKIIFTADYRDPEALRAIETYSHLWLIWGFSANKDRDFHPTVRPPMLGGNTRLGVFATRSPYRPNPLGLSVVLLDSVEKTAADGVVLHVSGADLLDGTPIYDIKPYLPYVDSYPEAIGGFTDQMNYAARKLSVEISDELLEKIPSEKRASLLKVLSLDPCPTYQNDENRVYGLAYGGYNIKFRVEKKILIVENVDKI